MDRLLQLLLRVFSNTDQIQKLLFNLAARLLENVDDPKDCKEHLLQMLKEGTLDDHFKEDPLCVIVCIAYVVLEFADHDHDVDPSQPIIIGDDPEINEFAEVLQIGQPAGGPLTDALVQLVINKLIELLQEYLDKWLS